MHEELRFARETCVGRFVALSEQDVLRATRLHLEHNAYDDLRSKDLIKAVNQRLNDPEETNPIYRVIAAPVTVNWEPPQGRGDRHRPVPASTVKDVESLPTEGTLPHKVKNRIGVAIQSVSFERTTSGTVATREQSKPGDTRVVRIARITSSSTSRVAPGLYPPITPQAKTSRATAMRSTSSQSLATQAELATITPRRRTSTQSPASVSVIKRLRTTRGTQAKASTSRARRT
jgi:hypothetical protein